MNSVQVLRSGQNGHPQVRIRISVGDDVLRIEVVQHGTAGDDVDTADGVDHVNEPDQADPYVVVDVNAEVVLDGGDRATWPTVRVRAVDLAHAAHGKGDVQVTRDRKHDHLLGHSVYPHEDHRLGQHPVADELGVVVRTEQQYRESAAGRSLSGRGQRCRPACG